MAGEFGFATGPYVNIAAFCERVLEEKDGVFTLVRIIDKYTVHAQGPQAPDAMPANVITPTFVVLLKRGEARGGQRFKVSLELPDGTRQDGPEAQINFQGGPESGANIVMPMQIQITMPGLYWAEAFVNDRLVARAPLTVIYEFTRGPGTRLSP